MHFHLHILLLINPKFEINEKAQNAFTSIDYSLLENRLKFFIFLFCNRIPNMWRSYTTHTNQLDIKTSTISILVLKEKTKSQKKTIKHFFHLIFPEFFWSFVHIRRFFLFRTLKFYLNLVKLKHLLIKIWLPFLLSEREEKPPAWCFQLANFWDHLCSKILFISSPTTHPFIHIYKRQHFNAPIDSRIFDAF